jgi:hypothetical protein
MVGPLNLNLDRSGSYCKLFATLTRSGALVVHSGTNVHSGTLGVHSGTLYYATQAMQSFEELSRCNNMLLLLSR